MEETDKEYEARSRAVLEALLCAKDSMDVGKMLQELAGIGWDAALVYDDNGHWAIPEGGSASISCEVENWEGAYFAGKDVWRSSPRAAVVYAIERALSE